MLVSLLIARLSIIEQLELLAIDYLSIMHQTFNTGTSREMAHVHLKPLFIIKTWVTCNGQTARHLAQTCEIPA